MLTKGDDYPLHQTPEPIASVGTHQNFYDRYYFNGYGREGEDFFSVAMGIYPYRNVIDASFSVIQEKTQHSIHASRVLSLERMDTRVGPISVEILEPLHRLRIRIADNEYGLSGDIAFEGRAPGIEEPRFTLRQGNRTTFDYTRMTQNGAYTGWLNVRGRRVGISPDRYRGTRDRSWGIRPIGNHFSDPMAPTGPPQFFWLWAPVNFEDRLAFYATNEFSDGTPWHRSSRIAPLDGSDGPKIVSSDLALSYRSGTRRVERAVLDLHLDNSDGIRLVLEPQFQFYMSGLGYNNPEWGHGVYKGDDVAGYEAFDLDTIDENAFQNLHIQAFVRALMIDEKKREHRGCGVLEQTILGPHEPSGFRDLFDMAP